MKQISMGAEAVVYLDNGKITKDRLRKKYRITQIDEKLRSQRTRREASILEKLTAIGFASPRIHGCDEKNARLMMQHIFGPKVRDILEESDIEVICKDIGLKIAILHKNSIMHGDLTTSNMILHDGQVYFVDFGLSFLSERIEDMAVDLHLLRQALESKHYRVWQKAFSRIISTYQEHMPSAQAILDRLEIVETRGRYKQHGS